MISLMPACVLERKREIMRRQWISAIFMIMTGWCIFAVSDFYKPHPLTAVAAETETITEAAVSGQTDTEADITEETAFPVETETEASYQPALDELNLAHYFPEGEDSGDLMKSYGGKAFIELMTQDQIWIGKIYDYADIAPEKLAARIGKPKSAVLGNYNPRDDRHDPEDPNTWTINSFRDMRIRVFDGDHKPVSLYSNVIEIMSMANVYTYYKGVEDYELFSAYCRALWDGSHSYSISMSDIEYCDGCLTEEDERKRLEREAEAEESEENAEALVESAAIEPDNGYMSEGNEYTASEAEQGEITTRSRDIEAKTGQGEKAGSSEQAAAEQTGAAAAAGQTGGAAETGQTGAAAETGQTGAAEKTGQTGAAAENENESPATSSPETSSVLLARSPDASEAGNTEETIETETIEILPEENKPLEPSPEATPSDYQAFPKKSEQCPGHVDLIVQIQIRGMKEKNGLFKADSYGNDTANYEENGWQGWNQESIDAARRLSSQDWYEKYKMTVSMISAGNPLTSAEIEEYMNSLPAATSQIRRDLVRFALSSVGKVPYYWGGKPSAPNYSRNAFGSLIAPDNKGRVLKGLDCSGWISWVYWSVTGKHLAHESTSGLALCGSPVSRSRLQPGDIILRTGENAHVIMFLGWTEDGKIRCIHESSGDVNNVMVSVRDANWPYYRNLID